MLKISRFKILEKSQLSIPLKRVLEHTNLNDDIIVVKDVNIINTLLANNDFHLPFLLQRVKLKICDIHSSNLKSYT